MKILLFIPLLFISSNQVTLKVIDKQIYISYYSEYYKNPIKVVYKLYKPTHVVNRTGSFYFEPGIKTATNEDFVNNIYDKGHLAPCEDFSNGDMNKTFSYINCAVQHSNLNRGVWKELETNERLLAQMDSLFITCEVIFSKTSKKLPTGAYIPDKFRKTIKFLSTKKKIIYEFPNTVCIGSYKTYQKQ